MLNRQIKRQKSHRKIRMKIMGTKDKPRLAVFRSQKHIYAQLIDDLTGKILISVSDLKMSRRGRGSSIESGKGKKGKVEHAKEIGKLIAKEAAAKKIDKVVFDRAGFIFHGRVKAIADGAREGGLKF